MERETQLQFGRRLGRQRPHLAPEEGAELECLKRTSAVEGNEHPKRVSPGPDHLAVSEGLGPERGAPGPLVLIMRSGGYSRNETLTPQTSRKVHYSSLLHPYPPQHHQRGQYQAPRFPSPTKAPPALSSPQGGGGVGAGVANKSRALDGAGTRETLLPVGLPCKVASSAVAPAVHWVRQKDSEPPIFEGGNAAELHI